MRSSRRKLQIESLQRRDLMTVESLAWDGASSLRLSFVPDGTIVGNQVSDADSVLSASAAGAKWKESVAEAFQIWAQYAEINIGIVSDSGDPLGVRGPVRGDDRFGEIRVAGIPMTGDTWAAAVNHDKLSAGTWAGDLLFNTDANWNLHPDDLLKAALHEAGHVLGLPHNADPASPMHAHGIPSTAVPAASDIALLQQLYGLRKPDANEVAKPNDSIHDATRIRFSNDPTKFNGSKSLVHYGEIQNELDRDVFFFELPSNYFGTSTIHAVSRGMSQLQFRFKVTDRNGVELASGDSTSQLGGDVALTIARPVGDTKLYLHIEPIGDPLAKVGSYAIIAQLDDLITTDYSQTLQATQTAHRWFASSATSLTNFDVSSLVDSDKDPVLNDDGGTDDNPSNAPRIEPYADSNLRRASLTIGSISTAQDADYFRFRSPKPPLGKIFGMLVQIESLERDQLIPKVTVLDKQLLAVEVEQFVQGNGTVLLWVPNVKENEDYTVRLAGASSEHATGNYEVAVAFQETKPLRKVLATGHLSLLEPEAPVAWYVARPQLFTLAIRSTSSSAVIGSAWANVYDEQLRSIATIAGDVGQLRTGPAILLQPGTYYLQFGASLVNATSSSVLNIELSGSADTDPIGPPPTKPGSTPVFTCPDETGDFCYPENIRVPAPFIFVPAPIIVLPTAFPVIPIPLAPPPDKWFWNNQFLRTNTVQREDTNNSGSVTPIDALLVINYLNSFRAGFVPAPPVVLSGMIDTNGDGLLSPIDALLVINYLNVGGNQGQAEGEAQSDLARDLGGYTPEQLTEDQLLRKRLARNS